MTQTAFGTKIKELRAGLFAIGWCGILSPFALVLTKITLFNEAFRAALFNSNPAALGNALSADFEVTMDTILHTTNVTILVGAMMFLWLILVFVMYGYGSGKVNACNKQILRLAEYYMCGDIERILIEHRYIVNNLKLFESKGIATEKFNLKMANVLIRQHNNPHLCDD